MVHINLSSHQSGHTMDQDDPQQPQFTSECHRGGKKLIHSDLSSHQSIHTKDKDDPHQPNIRVFTLGIRMIHMNLKFTSEYSH